MAGLAGYMSIGRATDDAIENLRRTERKAFLGVRIALHDLAECPLSHELKLTGARRQYANVKAVWAAALRDLDAAEGLR